MARNYKQPGVVDDRFVNGTGVKILSGSLVKYGELAAVALVDIEPNATGSVQLAEVFEVAKKADDNMAVRGTKVYLDHVNKRVQLATGNDGGSPAVAFVYAGVVFAPAAGGVAVVSIKLNA